MGSTSIGIGRLSIPVSGLLLAVVAVLMFSGTVPATRIAVATIDPTVVGVGRSVVGALLAIGYLIAIRAPRPNRSQLFGIAVVALGAGVGFGYFTADALKTVSATHGSVVIGILPMLTAVVGSLRTGDRPPVLFWIATAAGTAVVVVYAVMGSPSAGLGIGDLYLFAALLCAATAYAEGGRLARTMPGGQVIAWGLVAALPLSVPLTALALRASGFAPSTPSLVAVAYMAVFSVFVGMILWYRAMGLAGVPRASSVQLAQPVLSVVLSWLLLGEPIRAETIVAALLVLICVATAQRARVSAAPSARPREIAPIKSI